MLSWTQPASRAVSMAFVCSMAAAQPLLLGAASQSPQTTGSASESPVPCDEMNAKARALVDSGRTEDARNFLNAAIQACTGTGSRSDNERLAGALLTLGFVESTTQPQEALQHLRRAMALDPENMRGPQNVGGMLISLGQYAEALEVLEKALKHGTDDKKTLFGLEFNAGFALLNMCAARQAGCDGRRAEAHFVRASELNPASPDTFFNLAAITNDIHHDSRRAMELFKKACDLGHELACSQYGHFRSRIAALDRQAQGTLPTAAVAAPKFDGRGWTGANHQENATGVLTEYVLPGQSVDTWKELVTCRVFNDRRHIVPLGTFFDKTHEEAVRGCPSLVWNVIQRDEKTVIFEHHDAGCGGAPESNIVRLQLGDEGIHSLAYAARINGPLTPQKRNDWMAILTEDPRAEGDCGQSASDAVAPGGVPPDRETSTVEALAERIRQAYICPAVVKSTQDRAEEGVVIWTVECSSSDVYTVIVGRTGETTVIQKPK